MSIRNNNGSGNSRGNSRNSRSNFRSSRSGKTRNPAQIRKSAESNKAKYLSMAKDALSQDDRVLSEYWFQHVHHYDSVLQELNNSKNENESDNKEVRKNKRTTKKIKAVDDFKPSDEAKENKVASQKDSDIIVPQGIPGAGQIAGDISLGEE